MAKPGCGFQTKNRYRFGWFSMKLKLVGGDSAGVVTAYYMISDAGKERDELDFEFLGNRTGQSYTLQTNIYKGGIGGREMRHMLWFDPTKDFHTYSFLWNDHQIVGMFSSPIAGSLWIECPLGCTKTQMQLKTSSRMRSQCTCFQAFAPFVSTYKDFHVEACQWEDPYPACVSTTQNWWDQYDAWILSDGQKVDFSWVGRNLVIYDYCTDTTRYPKLPAECSSSDVGLHRQGSTLKHVS
ncbi:putative xyloglucan endotransglucosylase/hydrolase protein 8 [Nymphaea thermarum]|nr:putative xyloglucan endotransglucosylase/hydrolase protein 8 [Nymphaea thermarum]